MSMKEVIIEEAHNGDVGDVLEQKLTMLETVSNNKLF